jgi:hypothetical protein
MRVQKAEMAGRAAVCFAALPLLLLTACGSTVRLQGSSAAGGAASAVTAGETGLTGDAPTGSTVTGSGPGAPAVGTAGSVTMPAMGTASVPSGSVRATGASTTRPASRSTAAGKGAAGATAVRIAPPGTSGPGYTAKEIYIGVAYDSTYSQQLGAVGVSSGSATVGDQKAQVEAIVKDINTHGGIAGRAIAPVFYDTKGINGQNDPSVIAQAACSAWTEDRRVFAAMTYVVQMDNDTLYNCLARKQIVFAPLGGESTAAFTRYSPFLWSPAGVTPERLVPVWMQRLSAIGYFGGWDKLVGQAGAAPVKIGLLYGSGLRNNQSQLDDAFVKAVKKALALQGRSVDQEFQVSNNQADEAAAVLAFNNAGVTHVIGDYSIVNFTQAAESQHYRPRYGFSSFGGGAALKLFAPPGQLHGALGVGWAPSIDVDPAQDPGDVSPAATHCRQVMQQANQPSSVSLAWFAMGVACDTFNFFAAVIPKSGFSAAGFSGAAAALGSMPPSVTFSISFPGGRPDGVGAVRDMGYGDDCGCFSYLSKQNHAL